MVRRQIKEANSGSFDLFHLLDLRIWSRHLCLTKLLKKLIKEKSDLVLLSEFVDLRDLGALI